MDENETHNAAPEDNPGNPAPGYRCILETDFALLQQEIRATVAMVQGMNEQLKPITTHVAVCSERWMRHAEEHDRLRTGARATDAGNFVWAVLTAAGAWIMGRG